MPSSARTPPSASASSLELAHAARLAAIDGDVHAAERLLEEAHRLASGRTRAWAGALHLAEAEIHMEHAQWQHAEVEAEAARLAFAQEGSLVGQLHAREVPARILARRGDDDRALAAFQELDAIWGTLHGPRVLWGRARCLTFIASLHRRHLRLDDALTRGEEAVALARKLGEDFTLQLIAANTLAGVHFAMACKLHPATRWASHVTSLAPSAAPAVQKHCRAALVVLEALWRDDGSYMQTMTASNMAQVLVLMDRANEALPYMERFLAYTTMQKKPHMQADAHLTIGWAQLACGRPREAVRSLERARKIALGIEAKSLLRTIHYDLSIAFEALGRLDEAMHHHNEYSHLAKHVPYRQALAGQAKQQGDEASLEPFYLKRAEAFIRTHLHASPAIEDIADHAGASVRAIQLAFRKFRATTPIGYSIDTRLRAARDALVGGHMHGDSIRALCQRYGFNDPSRFARDFQQRFGALPSELAREMAQ
ncbi:MAG: helix-turn-helix transcriptional regulator [Betaproteobacteria bacterium]|nr:helix-turn-helix transcriptional regulator [Betaproteobacteria bacterium]